MEIVFSGICCWVDTVPANGGKTVIIRNALNGGAHDGTRIPPHYAFIHAKRGQVNDDGWRADWGSESDVLYWLTGDRLTLDPAPAGGGINISVLPHVAERVINEPICSGADEIRPGYLDAPVTANVLGLLDLPADADVQCGTTDRGAAFAVLQMPSASVTITATPFADSMGEQRSLTIVDPDARVFIVNVNMPEYMAGLGAPDDDHKYLVCDIFQRHTATAQSLASISPSEAFAAGAQQLPSHATAELCDIDDGQTTAIKYAAGQGRAMKEYLDTLAGGCSASQWP
jgi:hypothetical protein